MDGKKQEDRTKIPDLAGKGIKEVMKASKGLTAAKNRIIAQAISRTFRDILEAAEAKPAEAGQEEEQEEEVKEGILEGTPEGEIGTPEGETGIGEK